MSVEVDFWTRYSSLCLKAKVCPLQSVFKRLKGTEFHCAVEVIRSENWPLLLSALSVDNSLTKIQFVSNHYSVENQKDFRYERKRRSGLQFPVPYGCSEKNVSDICKCIAQILSNSETLTILKIENLYLKEEDAFILEKAFKNSCVEEFSLSGCKFQDDAFEIFCRGLQLSNVQWIDFSSCDLNTSSISSVCKLIKAHNLRRSNEMFQHTLRYQLPVFDAMKGLNRITLNDNEIGDEAVEMLINSFCEDVWIKALDLQKCCIENDGAISLLNVVKRNAGLQLIDLRLNDIDEEIVHRIALQLALNNVGKVLKYNIGALWKPSKNIKRISNRKTYLRTKVLKYSPPKVKLLKKDTTRAAMTTKSSNVSTDNASSQTSLNYDKELRKAKKIIAKHHSLLNLLKRYKMENQLLQKEIENLSTQDDYILIDHDTFSEVNNTFEKFKKFLGIMREYGLWECVTILESNESAGNILKPLIFDAIKKCMQTVKSGSSSDDLAQSNGNFSSNDFEQEFLQFKKHSDLFFKQKQDHQSKTTYKNHLNEPNLFFNRVLPEMNHVKKPMPSDKALAQKVFKEVMESYTSSSLSSDPARTVPKMPVYSNKKDVIHVSLIKDFLSETDSKIKKLKMTNNKFSSVSNDQVQSIAYHLSLQSNVPSTSNQLPYNNPQDLTNVMDSEKAKKKVIESIPEMSQSSSQTLRDSTSTRHKTSEIESDHSSTYKTLPDLKQKVNPLSEDINPELLSEKESIAHSSKTNSKSYRSSHNQTPSKLESSKSSRHSKAKVVSQRSKLQSSSSSSKHNTLVSKHPIPELPANKVVVKSSSSSSKHNTLVSKQPMPEVPANTVLVKSSSSATSYSSYNSKNSLVENESVHSSPEETGSEKSYLESVEEASTDKDVKSLAEEVYSSEDEKEDSKKSVNTVLKTQVQEESSSPAAEMHSELVKKIAHSGSNQPSEVQLTLKKATVEVSDEKPENEIKSESSMPSLSDITTVSSKSLNTDSVMGQLSD